MNSAGYILDNSFTINHLSFGEKKNFARIAKQFPDAGVEHPLDGFSATREEGKDKMKCGFYIKAVPAIFVGDTFARIFEGLESVIGRIIRAVNHKGKRLLLLI